MLRSHPVRTLVKMLQYFWVTLSVFVIFCVCTSVAYLFGSGEDSHWNVL